MRAAVVVALAVVLLAGLVAVNTLTGDADEIAGTPTVTVPAADQRGAAGLVPPAVAQTRSQLLAAADAGDHERLAALAPEDFSYTFGAPAEGGPAEYWRRLEEETGEDPLATLAALLRLPYTLQGGIYTWPFAFDRPLDELTEYERDLLSEAIAVEEAYAAGVGYAGWRVGIERDGTWRFFVAGD